MYLINQLYRPLLRWDNQSLQSELAQSCKYETPSKILCKIRENLKFSDGSPLTAKEIVQSFKDFINPQNKYYKADLLFGVRHAEEIFAGKIPVDSLGVTANNALEVVFDLQRPDSEFIFNLANPFLSVQKKSAFSGPFVIKSIIANKKILLQRNPHYGRSNPQDVFVEFRFVADDSAMLNLYELGELDMVRRIPTSFIPKLKHRKDYFEIDQYRFDYIGFSKDLDFKIRKALSESLPFDEFQKLYYAKPRPGCPGIPQKQIGAEICIQTKNESLKKEQKINNAKSQLPIPLEFVFSKLGGDNHFRTAEWLQWQWAKNLNFKVRIHPKENKIFLEDLKKVIPTIFRKGISPERPTCLASLEIFQNQHPENYLKIEDATFQNDLRKMQIEMNPQKKQALCQKSLRYLISNFLLIPTGPIFFSFLVSPKWTGWQLNELNHLDLYGLKFE
jgi:oligopeptide transport system substrate-binding protein